MVLKALEVHETRIEKTKRYFNGNLWGDLKSNMHFFDEKIKSVRKEINHLKAQMKGSYSESEDLEKVEIAKINQEED